MKLNKPFLFIIIVSLLFISCKRIAKQDNKKIHYTYYSNGKIETECEYTDSIKDGVYKKFYSNGKLSEIGHFLKGKRNGLFITYDSLGNRLKEQVFALSYIDNPYVFYTNDSFEIDKKESFINMEIQYNKNGLIDSLNSYFYKTYQNKDTTTIGDTIKCKIDLCARIFKSKKTKYEYYYNSLNDTDKIYRKRSIHHVDSFEYIPRKKGNGKIFGMISEKDVINKKNTIYFFNFKYYVK